MKEIAAYHKEWVLIAKSFGEQYPEDLVQDMYLKLHDNNLVERIIQDGKVNKGYIWITLRTMFLDTKRKKKLQTISLGEGFQIEDSTSTESFEAAFEEFTYRMYSAIMDLDKPNKYPYNKELFKLYVLDDMSLRQIEKETTIPYWSVYNTIDACRDKLKETLSEDWEDICNKDFELI